MDITGIAKSHKAGIQKTGKASSKKEWKLSDSLREQIAGYAREDAAQNVYMGNKFLALRKSEVAGVALNGRETTDREINCEVDSWEFRL